MKARLPADPGRRRMVESVQTEFRRVSTALAPQLAPLGKDLGNLNVAQNVMRDCLTAVLEEMAPYGHQSAIDIARRLASYALSTVPMEDQDEVVSAFLAGFADFHMMRTAQGAVIRSEWMMPDGDSVPNFPKD